MGRLCESFDKGFSDGHYFRAAVSDHGLSRGEAAAKAGLAFA